MQNNKTLDQILRQYCEDFVECLKVKITEQTKKEDKK